MRRFLPYWLIFTVPAAALLGFWAGGVWMAATIAYLFVAVPIFEALLGLRTDNDGTQEAATGRTRLLLDLPLYAWIPVQLGLQAYGVALIVSGELAIWESLLTIASIGLLATGGGINIAHEFMHRKGKFQRAMSELLMGSVTYSHFCVEHVYGHHKHVATPLDAASSRRGESVYRFLPRSFALSLLSAVRIENRRAQARGISRWGLRHRITRYAVTQLAIYGLLGLLGGPIAMLAWLGQSLVATVMLETINYVEHYGLRRRELSPGKFERIAPWHSWNASHRLTNWLLFNLQRHSDHHFLASRSYDQLRHYDDVPQLPAGYATMILLSLVPPLWRRLMDRRVDAWNERREDIEHETALAA